MMWVRVDFPAPFGPEQRERLTLRDRQIDATQHLECAIAFMNVIEFLSLAEPPWWHCTLLYALERAAYCARAKRRQIP